LSTESDDQSSLQCVTVSTDVMSDRIGRRDASRGGRCSKTSAYAGLDLSGNGSSETTYDEGDEVCKRSERMMLLNDRHGPGTSRTSSTLTAQSSDRAGAASPMVALTSMGGSGARQHHRRAKWKRHRGGEWRLRPGTIRPIHIYSPLPELIWVARYPSG